MSTAIIRFIPAERGGRSSPPADATRYSTIAKFESDPHFEQKAWSIILDRVTPLRGPECILAEIRFLFPDAPAQLLGEGERFELLEGKKIVAKGVVLPNRISIPASVNDFELALLG